MIEKKYIIFNLNTQKFAVDIDNIGGVTEYKEVTKIPNLPEHIVGVMNLRGNIVPILDLKSLFSLAKTNITKDARIILLYHDKKTYGFIVDEVSRVKNINKDEIEDTNSLIKGLKEDYIVGVGKMENELVTIIDLNFIIKLHTEKLELSHIEEVI